MACGLSTAARAADPQAYEVKLNGAGGGKLETALDASSLLISLHDQAPPAPFALIGRARGDEGRINSVLSAFGYYGGKLTIAIAGHPLDDADLPDVLDEIPTGQKADVAITIDKGPLYTWRSISIDWADKVWTKDADVPPAIRDSVKLSPGEPALAADAVAAQANLLVALQEDGHAFASVATPIAYPDDAKSVVDLVLKASAGPRVAIGRIIFHGLKDVNEAFVRRMLMIAPGDLYQPSKIEVARQKLVALGVFASLSVRPAAKANEDGTVDLIFDATERPKHAVQLSGIWSTDLGFSASVSWSHRNLFGNAEQLNLSAAMTNLGGSAVSGLGYNLSAQTIEPGFLARNQSLSLSAVAVRQDLDAYSQTAETLGGFVKREISPEWNASLGLSITNDDVTQESENRLYQLLALPLAISLDTTGLVQKPLSDPSEGIRASFALTPTHGFGANPVTFAILQASGATYFDLAGDGRSVLALRTLLGSIVGASLFDLPPDQRLYAGGSGTVRGFRYQSIGPHFADGKPTGAAAIDAATIEFRQRIGEEWGAAAFVDAGQASANSLPFQNDVNVGAGAGVRYYTPIGAVRADVAVPLTRVPNGDSFEIYIGIGQAF